MNDLALIPPAVGVIGLIVAVIIYFIVRSYDEGSEALKKIADQIHLGAMVFMRREYSMLAIFATVLLVLIYFSGLGPYTAAAFLAGALSSAAAGWFGMYTATKANVRTTNAAHELRPSCGPISRFFWRLNHGIGRGRLWLARSWSGVLLLRGRS